MPTPHTSTRGNARGFCVWASTRHKQQLQHTESPPLLRMQSTEEKTSIMRVARAIELALHAREQCPFLFQGHRPVASSSQCALISEMMDMTLRHSVDVKDGDSFKPSRMHRLTSSAS
mmetsp:Transcript_4872/g.14538  ORF Transcript_4872/g.14538 Transcript_4872/m.14538 type:complete len:117 (-) Transcript_4872:521-871(-)